MIAAGGVESKSNIDTAALINGARGSKNSKSKKPQDTQDFLKNLKVDVTGQVVLWDTTTGRQIATLKGHGKGVAQVALSRDGKLLASAGTDLSGAASAFSAGAVLRMRSISRASGFIVASCVGVAGSAGIGSGSRNSGTAASD